MDPAICITNLSVSYRDIPALWNISIDFPKNQIIAVVGPNGAGKSTLLKAILGLIGYQSGSIKILGDTLSKLKERHKKIAYVPQRESVDWDFPINCLEVVLMGRYAHIGWFKRPKQVDKQLALDALEKFGMSDYKYRQISELSGGQKQRVFLARALVQDAEIYILDEPFGGIDALTEEFTLTLLQELKNIGKTIIVVTHDLQSLQSYFDYVFLLNTQAVAFGTPEEVLTPDILTQTYGGYMHMVYGKVSD
jgi:manganese/zinc/iron transport system ATP- binding protein